MAACVQTLHARNAPLQDQGCDLIVALTHSRSNNDRKLAAEVPEIDLVLGGHDHDFESDYVHNFNDPTKPKNLFIKSGTDFRWVP